MARRISRKRQRFNKYSAFLTSLIENDLILKKRLSLYCKRENKSLAEGLVLLLKDGVSTSETFLRGGIFNRVF